MFDNDKSYYSSNQPPIEEGKWQSAYYSEDIPAQPPQARKKPRRFGLAKTAAAMAAVMLVSAASGAGGAYLAVSRMEFPEPPAQIPVISHEAPPISQISQPEIHAGEELPVYGDITSVVKQVSASVVEITTQSTRGGGFFGGGTARGAGSGVIISPDGYIVTNDHVIEDAQTITVRMHDGTEYTAALIGSDAQSDLAVIKIEAAGLTAAGFADSDEIEVGQLAIAIGNPLGELGGTVTSGIISAKGRELNIQGETMTLLQTSAAVNRGNSGGGLFDGQGGLVGIVNAKSAGSGIEGLGFAIPSNTVRKITGDLIDLGYVSGRPQFGIHIIDIPDARTAAAHGIPATEPGLYIARSDEGNGLLAGDMFVSINGSEIRRGADITEILRKSSVGDTVSVTIKRGGEEMTVDVTLTERIPEELRSKPAET